MQTEEVSLEQLVMAKYMCKESTLFFTRYFFKQQYNKKFIIGPHHVKIAEKLDAVLRGEIKRLIINIAPRYGKTELCVKSFIAKGLSENPASKYIHLSYSDDLALDNSEAVKDLVDSEEYKQLYGDKVQIKRGSAAKKKWYTNAGGGVYATAAGGQVTGFGAGLVEPEESEDDGDEELDSFFNEFDAQANFGGALIIDDPIKPEDADSETKRERINQRFDSTIKNRVNSRNTPIIIIMQRLHENDLCGYLTQDSDHEWEVLSLPAIITKEPGQDLREGEALWPHKHTLEELLKDYQKNPINFQRQYQQDPKPKEGLMYERLRTYTEFPITKTKIRKAYIDTADTGDDFLCAIFYDETEIGCFVFDVLYTNAPMTETEQTVPKLIAKHWMDLVRIEANNGGLGFKRTVENNLRILGNRKTRFIAFHQSKNKEERIFQNSSEVQNMVYFPNDWALRWPEFHRHVTTYLKAGGNAHDDAEDALTGVVEFIGKDKGTMDKEALDVFFS